MADKKDIPLALLEILTKYTDENTPLPTRDIIRIMENEYGVTMERRTLYANIELLQKFGHKISTWNDNGSGYYLEEHQFKKSEVFMLCNAIHSSHFISAKESKEMIDKLLATLSRKQKAEYIDKVYLPNKKKTKINSLLDNIHKISTAISEQHPVRFTYLQYSEDKTLKPRREKPYEVEPRYIVYHDSRPYVIATSDHHDGFANYRIDRISNIKIVSDKKVTSLRKDLDAYEYTKNMYYMFNDEQTSAVIRCEKRILDHVLDIFGTDCRILPADTDHFDVHVHGSETGVILFAQQYLDAAEIIEPQELRTELLRRLNTTVRKYKC